MSNPDDPKLDPGAILQQAAALARHLERSGVHWMPKPRPESVQSLVHRFTAEDVLPEPADRQIARTALPQPVTTSPATAFPTVRSIHQAYPGNPIASDQRQAALDQINDQVRACLRCEILSSCRTNTVFGEGNPAPRFVFFGEGPGADEDRMGRPFVGKAGQLLTKMIEACTLQRQDVYIMNTVKCRPPGNRNPEPEELQNCREYYQQQLAILRPEYIVCLGAISGQELLQSKLPVGKLRGRMHPYFESKVLVTYHPAYLLRTPAAKKAAWEDLQRMMRDAGIKRP